MTESINYDMSNLADDSAVNGAGAGSDTANQHKEFSAQIEEMSFRQAMEALNNIVSQLESNTLELEESMEKYKEGVELLANLKMRLDGAQQEVEALMGQLEAKTLSDAESDKTLS